MSTEAHAFTMTRPTGPEIAFVKLDAHRMIVKNAPGLLPGYWVFCDVTTGRDLWRAALANGARRSEGDNAEILTEGLAWVERVNREEDAKERRGY